jgi:hypothetical protein
MRKFLRVSLPGFCLFMMLLLSQSPLAAAHVLKQDNGVDAVMHIPPDDNPIAGQTTNLEFLFSKDAGGFQLNDYSINVQVTDNGKSVQKEAVTPAFFGSADQGDTAVMFPKIGVYQLMLMGTAKSSTNPSFMMTYLVRVASSVNGQSMTTSNNGIEVVLIGLTVAVVFGMVTVRQVMNGRRYAKVKSSKSNKK